MYQLSIDHANSATVSVHPDHGDAAAALHGFADGTDCTVTTTQAGNESSSFELTSLTTGKAYVTATIEHDLSSPARTARFAELKQLRDVATAADTGNPLVDAYERDAMQMAWDDLTGASSHRTYGHTYPGHPA